MRISHLTREDCQRRYDEEGHRVAEFELRRGRLDELGARKQYAWYVHATTLVRLATVAYAMGKSLAECRCRLLQATQAYREVFALRGTAFYKRTLYKDGQPLPEEIVSDDGYSSVDSFNAGCVALSIGDFDLARDLVTLAGASPNASLVSPRSEVCRTNEQTLSHALNALLESDMALASREAAKLSVRRATRMEQQLGRAITALAGEGNFLSERDALLDYHAKEAAKRANQLDCRHWICFPAIALSALAERFLSVSIDDLKTESEYCPLGLMSGIEGAGE